jgi:gamma-carbonic anhydrase
MSAEPSAEHSVLFTLPYAGVHPTFSGPPTISPGPDAVVLGRVKIGRNAYLAAQSVIRADGHHISIADDFAIGSNATVHIAHDLYPTRIGNYVTMEEDTVAHACDIGNNCLLQRGAVVLDGAVIPDDVVLLTDALIFPRSRLQQGRVYAGQPARAVRSITADQLSVMHRDARGRMLHDTRAAADSRTSVYRAPSPDVFLARTCIVRGAVLLQPGVSIWYGCEVDAGDNRVTIGERCNIQDNTRIRSLTGPVTIGTDTTIGHNASLVDCSVGSHSLIGIGSVVSAGTIVQDDVLLAAGAHTESGQVLTAGLIWAGRPARPLKPLDASSREAIRSTPSIYATYAQQFGDAQRKTRTMSISEPPR